MGIENSPDHHSMSEATRSMQNKARVNALKGMRCWWPSGQPPYITLILTTLIISVHAITQGVGWAEAWRETLGLQPGMLHTYMTYAILHTDPNHLKENAALIIIFGPLVEGLIGRKNYSLATVGLILIGGLAATTLAHGYWPSEERPVGLSTMTYALFPAGIYALLSTIWNHLGAIVSTTITFLILLCGVFVVDSGPALVGHAAALICGAAIVGIHIARLNSNSHRGPPVRKPKAGLQRLSQSLRMTVSTRWPDPDQ